MTDLEIAKELKQCSAWSWADGMALVDAQSGERCGRLVLDLQGELYLPIGPADWESSCVPDVRDGATLGALMDLLKGHHLGVQIHLMARYSGFWSVMKPIDGKIGEGPTQAAAVLSAFKALEKT